MKLITLLLFPIFVSAQSGVKEIFQKFEALPQLATATYLFVCWIQMVLLFIPSMRRKYCCHHQE
jgi:hypothetical protein